MTSEKQQTVLLTKTFFGRLFESDLMPAGLPQVQLVIWVIAFIGGPSVLLPVKLAKKYMYLLNDRPALLNAMAVDRVVVMLLLMIATGLITLVLWEGLFPDRRDGRILGVLPIRLRTFVVSRLAALVMLFAMLVVATTFLSAITFGVINAMFDGPGGLIGGTLSTFAATAGAEAVVFFGIIAVQCALLNVAGAVAAQRLAVLLQIALVVVLLQMPLLLSAFVSARMPVNAPLVAGLTMMFALGLYAATYRRLTRLALEGTGASTTRASVLRLAVPLAARFTTRSAPARAVCAFTLRTLVRSRQHRMILAGWMGLALAVILAGLVPLVLREGWNGFSQPRTAVLAAPLVLIALTLVGMRMLFAIPAEIRANWTVRTRQPVPVRLAVDGATGALIVAVTPAVILATVSAGWLWGRQAAIVHGLFCVVLGVLLAQALTLGLEKVPFTCTYRPGKARVIHFWPLYLTGFTTYTFTMAALEVQVLRRGGAAIALVILGTIACLLAITRHRKAAAVPFLCFEEEDDDALTVMSL